MRVAQQFIAGLVQEKGVRPVKDDKVDYIYPYFGLRETMVTIVWANEKEPDASLTSISCQAASRSFFRCLSFLISSTTGSFLGPDRIGKSSAARCSVFSGSL